MPLSEHEQRLLEQIERALVDDDPKFASSVRSGDRRLKARRKLQIGGLLLIVGLAVMIGGVVAQSIPIGILGAVVMFGGLPLVALNYKSATGAAEAGSGAASGAAGPTGKGIRPRRAWSHRSAKRRT